jgi:hypothetical protein
MHSSLKLSNMTTYQEERHASNKLVVKEAENNPQSMNLIPNFAKGIGKLKLINTEVDRLRALQEMDTGGVTENKNFTLDKLKAYTLDFAGAVHSYASDKSDLVLMKVVNYKSGKVGKMSQEKIIAVADIVLGEAKKVAPADLAKEGISVDELKEYDDMITYYHSLSTSVREAVIDKSGYTNLLALQFKASSALFKNSLTRLSSQFKRKDPEFYLKYMAARNHIDRGGPSGDTKDTNPKAS